MKMTVSIRRKIIFLKINVKNRGGSRIFSRGADFQKLSETLLTFCKIDRFDFLSSHKSL